VDLENQKLIQLKDIIKRLKDLKKQIDEDVLEARKKTEAHKLKEMVLTEEEIKGLVP